MATISTFERVEEQLRVIAEDYLEGIAKKLREDSMAINFAARIAILYREIVSFSDQIKMDLILMCTLGRERIHSLDVRNRHRFCNLGSKSCFGCSSKNLIPKLKQVMYFKFLNLGE
jgi:hypothetical protein